MQSYLMKARSNTRLSNRRGIRAGSATAAVKPAKTAKSVVKIKEILVPYDFSQPAEKALDYAIAFAKQFNGKITLLYVVEPVAFSDLDTVPLVLDNDTAVFKAKQSLKALKLQKGRRGSFIRDIKVNVGKPFQEITTLARGLRLDVIIIATHGRTGLKHVLLGSTSEKVIRHAPCPVLVVREKEHEIA